MTRLAMKRDLDFNRGDDNFELNEKTNPDIEITICQPYILLDCLLPSDVFSLRSWGEIYSR